MATARPIRSMDPYAQAFWTYTQKKELRLQKCSDCGKFRWPPGPTCDKCLSDEAEWATIAGRGKVLSWTTFRRKYFEEYPAPHTVIVLELDEGPLFVSYPVDIEVADLRESMTLSLRWTDGEDKFGVYNLPVFGPSSTQRAHDAHVELLHRLVKLRIIAHALDEDSMDALLRNQWQLDEIDNVRAVLERPDVKASRQTT